MKVLIIASDKGNILSSFVEEQLKALSKLGVEIVRYGVKGKGITGYLQEISTLRRIIHKEKPDLIHAHYGLCGLLANLQRLVPVVTTYHGSDINLPKNLFFSKISIYLSAYNIFVSKRSLTIAQKSIFTLLKSRILKHSLVLPCGIDLFDEQLHSRVEARKILGLNENEQIILFAGAFDNVVKDAPLAKAAVAYFATEMSNKQEDQTGNNTTFPITKEQIRLIELRGYTRAQVNLMMCAANCLLMTSKTEGSPQVIKEAMACGCPIVSVDVGDVSERTSGVEGCYIVPSREPAAIANILKKAIDFVGKTKGREHIIESKLENNEVAKTIYSIYQQVLS